MAEQCTCSKERDLERIEGRIDKVENKLDAQCEMVYKLEAGSQRTNEHLEKIEAALEKFPEAEAAIWKEHWNQVLERQNEQQTALIKLMIKEIAASRQTVRGSNKLVGDLVKGLLGLAGAVVLMVEAWLKWGPK